MTRLLCGAVATLASFAALGQTPAINSASPAAAELFNDLLPAAESIQPSLKILRQHLAAAIDLPVHMSGSGSTLFILAPLPLELPVIAARVRTAAPEAACHMTRLI